MQVKKSPGQKMTPVFTVDSTLTFGTQDIRLPHLYIEGASVADVATGMRKKSERMADLIPGASLTVHAIINGRISEARASDQKTPEQELGEMCAKSILEWLRQ